MSDALSFVKSHRVSFIVGFAIVVISLIAIYYCTRRLPTSFVVEGDTTAASFTTLEQTESQLRSGMFASSETPVDLIVLCSSLKHVGSFGAELPCNNGFLKLEHVFVEALRLGQNTRVDLLVDDENLEVMLTEMSREKSLVTLLFDSKSKALGPRPLPGKNEGEWIVNSGDAPIHLTFVHPHFHSGDEEGGQLISPGTAFTFQHNDESGFINNTGMLSIAGIESDLRKPLNEDLIQVYSVQSGQVRTLSPIISPSDGSLSGLHLQFQGESNCILTKSPLFKFKDADNHATTLAERFAGRHITRNWLLAALFSILVSLGTGVFLNHYSKRLDRRASTLPKARVD